MGQFRERYLRKSRKVTDMIPLAILISVLVMFLGVFFTSRIYKLFGLPEVDLGKPENFPGFTYMTLAYFSFIGLWVSFFIAMALPKANRRMLKDLLPNGRGN